MKVLIVSALQIYPPISGGQARTSSLAAALAKQGCDVCIFSLLGRKTDYLHRKTSGWQDIAPGIREYVFRNPLLGFFGILSYKLGIPPFWAWVLYLLKFALPEFRKTLASSDSVIADFPYTASAFYGIPKNKKKILNTHNVEANLFRMQLLRKMVQWIEQRASALADITVCCSEADAQHFRSVGQEVMIVPNGVKEERFQNRMTHRASMRQRLGFDDGDRVFLFAASAYGPNGQGLKFLEEFSAANCDFMVKNRIKFLIVGSVSKSPRSTVTMTITGSVDQIEPYFAASDFAINPIFFGSGTSVKLAEFIAARIPVLTTSVGARGFLVDDWKNMILFDETNLVETIASLLAGPIDLNNLTASAYKDNRHMIDIQQAVVPLLHNIQRHA